MPTVRTLPESVYYSGQGKIVFAERDPTTGRPINAYEIGNAPALEIAISTTQTDHKESMSGQRSTDKTLITEKSATFNITIESLDPKNLAAAFFGELNTVAAGTVTAEPIGSASAGGLLILRHSQVSDVVVHTVGATPAVVPPAAYFLDPDFGTIKLDPTYTPAVTGQLTADYSYLTAQRLDALTQVTPPERYVRFEGINTIDETLVLVEIPRAQFQPLQSLPLINDEIAQVQMTATILPDSFLNDGGSRYYRQTTIKPKA
jgi:hypothetical protein